VTLLLGALAPMLGSGAGEEASGTWPQWRHDGPLTGYQPLPGAMRSEPRILARYFVGAEKGAPVFADLLGTGKADDVVIAARAGLFAWDGRGKPLWTCAVPGYVVDRVLWVEDLAGDGSRQVVAVAGHPGGTRMALLVVDGRSGRLMATIDFGTGDFDWHAHCGRFLPGRPGRQIFLVTSETLSRAETAVSNGSLELWSYARGAARREWATQPREAVLNYPAVMVADLDRDGRMKAVVNSWCHVWVVDLASGGVISHCAWDPGGANHRHYGWNELVDVFGSGRLDYVVASTTKHVDVLRNTGRGLGHAWTRAWPDPVTTEAITIRYPADPVVELEGAGREIVSAVFDSRGERRWRLSVTDAATGREVAGMADRVPLASVAVLGPGRPRLLLCARSHALDYDPPESLEGWFLEKGAWRCAWTSRCEGLLAGKPVSDDLRALYFSNMAMRRPVTSAGADGRLEFFTREAGGRVLAWGCGADGRVVARPGSRPPTGQRPIPAAVPALAGTTVPYLLAADTGRGGNDLILYDDREAASLRLSGGRLGLVDRFETSEIPIVCDLMGDGVRWTLTAGRGADGNLWVEPRRPGAPPAWRFVFPGSASCGAYSERPHFFQVGHFTGGRHLDIFTYATKPAARTYLLDGRTGRIVWQRADLPAIERYFQPLFARAAAVDLLGVGRDEVVYTNPDYYCVADGRTGDLRVGPVELRPFFGWWAAYASPAVLRNPGGRPFAYLGGVYSSRGSIEADGSRGLWLEYLPTERWPMRPGNCGFNEGLLPPKAGRGWRVGQVEADGTLVCFDAETGRTAWRLPIGAATSGITTGNVDGGSSGHFVFGTSDGRLLAVADEGDRGRIAWSRSFDVPVGTPILADLDGDGRSEIAVSVADGWVYVLGP
jgi:PQQ-like domain